MINFQFLLDMIIFNFFFVPDFYFIYFIFRLFIRWKAKLSKKHLGFLTLLKINYHRKLLHVISQNGNVFPFLIAACVLRGIIPVLPVNFCPLVK